MKRKLWLSASMFAIIILASSLQVKAGINGNEASVIAAASGTFEYNGKYYQADSSYVSQLRAELDAPGVNLSASQARRAIGSINGSVADGVAQGALKEVGSVDGTEDPNEPDDDTNKTENPDDDDDLSYLDDGTGSGKGKSGENGTGTDSTEGKNGTEGNSDTEESTLSDEELAELAKKTIEDATGKTMDQIKDETAEMENELAAGESNDESGEGQDAKADLSNAQPIKKNISIAQIAITVMVIVLVVIVAVVFVMRKRKKQK